MEDKSYGITKGICLEMKWEMVDIVDRTNWNVPVKQKQKTRLYFSFQIRAEELNNEAELNWKGKHESVNIQSLSDKTSFKLKIA